MIAAGIDLGGTKIETQIFDADWVCVDRQRIDTPSSYSVLVQTLVEQALWADRKAGRSLPVGIGAAGLLNPASGLVYAANLPAMNRPLQNDIETMLGRKVTYINDCRALALSETVFGAGRGITTVAALILGTGVGGGLTIGGKLVPGFAAVGGEFGHLPASAHLIAKHGLPLLQCGCGRVGCCETLISGPGMTRIARRFMGQDISPENLVEMKGTNTLAAQVWAVWCDLLADLLLTLVFIVDPAAVVIAGGLSKIPNLIEDLTAALHRAQFPGFAIPQLVIAQGGDASGARGAAYMAAQEHKFG